MDYKKATLETLNSGAVFDLFNEEWKKILENVADPNVKPDSQREINIIIKVKPDKNCESAATTVETRTKLAPVKPHESFVLLSGDGSGVDAYVSDPKQQELDMSENVIQMKGEQNG